MVKDEFPHAAVATPPRGAAAGSWKRAISTAAIAVLCYQAVLTSLGGHIGGITKLLSSLPGCARHAERDRGAASQDFDWSSVAPQRHLSFEPCYGDFECARLTLPLDHFNGTNKDKTISLAVIKLPAKVPVTDLSYGGPILVNPGGPGGSGVGFLQRAGSGLQFYVDTPAVDLSEESARYFDIVSFDPRGIGYTAPLSSCFDAESARESWSLRLASEGILTSSNAAFGRMWGMGQAFGSNCAPQSVDEGNINQFITTASVVEDMVALVEELGKAREKQALQELPHLREAPERLQHKPGKEKLQYWGFSYGTLLGATFASMHPDRVGRAILDGVVDANDYTAGLWIDNLEDTEKVVQYFFDTCAAAGSSCPLAHDGATPLEVRIRLARIVDALYHRPLPVTLPGGNPEVLTYSDVRTLIFTTLYSPLQMFEPLAQILHAVGNRDATALLPYLRPQHEYACRAANDTSPPRKHLIGSEAQIAIICGDADPHNRVDRADFPTHIDIVEQLSPTAGPIWAMIRLACAGWKTRPLHRFPGKFGAAKTANPILLIGNTADPVTPLGSAKKMSALFPSSAVLTQKSPGHCSISGFSACTAAAVRAYFRDATLPGPGATCALSPPKPLADDDSSSASDAGRATPRWLARAMQHRGEVEAEAPGRVSDHLDRVAHAAVALALREQLGSGLGRGFAYSGGKIDGTGGLDEAERRALGGGWAERAWADWGRDFF